jgi:hypothetical protein
VSEPGEHPVADLEIRASWSARTVRWSRLAEVRTQISRDLDSEELRERERLPDHPTTGHTYRGGVGRWHLAAWLRRAIR